MPSDLLERMRRNPLPTGKSAMSRQYAANMAYCFVPERERPIVMRSIHPLVKY